METQKNGNLRKQKDALLGSAVNALRKSLFPSSKMKNKITKNEALLFEKC